jgi:hypothetical protein
LTSKLKREHGRRIGHTLRKPASAIENDALYWNPQGEKDRTTKKNLENNRRRNNRDGKDLERG